MIFNKTRGTTIIELCFLLMAYVFGSAQTWKDKNTPPFKVLTPLNEASMASAFRSWSGISKTPIGLECRFPDVKRHYVRGHGTISCFLDLTDMNIIDSIKKMMEYFPDYRIQFDEDGMVIIRPVKRTQLDRVVDKFVLTDSSTIKALEEVRRIFEPDYVTPDYPIDPPQSGESEYSKMGREAFNKRFEKKITVNLSNVSLETILTTIAKCYGDASWSVEYVTEEKRIEDSLVSIFKINEPTISAGPKRGRRVNYQNN